MWVTWLQLIDAFENDVNSSNASSSRLSHKLTAHHIFLNPYLRMIVYLASQVSAIELHMPSQNNVNQVPRGQLSL